MASNPAAEQAALRFSAFAALGIGITGVAWGLVASSQVILLDGVYAVLGVALSWLSLRASKAAAAGPTPRFPFGREALAPLMVGLQGLALLTTLAYASLEAVRVILAGGSEPATGAIAAYALISTVGALAAYAWLVRSTRRNGASDLVAAESRQWGSGAVFSLVVLLGTGVAVILRRTSLSNTEAYLDSVLVLLASAVLLPQPLSMIRTMLVELLEGAPGPAISEPVAAAVAQVRRQEGLPEPLLRVGKVGPKVYVEVDFVVPPGTWDVDGEDRVRHALADLLEPLPYDVWLNVEMTGDPSLVT